MNSVVPQQYETPQQNVHQSLQLQLHQHQLQQQQQQLQQQQLQAQNLTDLHNIEHVRVAGLKLICQSIGLQRTGNKDDMKSRILKHVAENRANDNVLIPALTVMIRWMTHDRADKVYRQFDFAGLKQYISDNQLFSSQQLNALRPEIWSELRPAPANTLTNLKKLNFPDQDVPTENFQPQYLTFASSPYYLTISYLDMHKSEQNMLILTPPPNRGPNTIKYCSIQFSDEEKAIFQKRDPTVRLFFMSGRVIPTQHGNPIHVRYPNASTVTCNGIRMDMRKVVGNKKVAPVPLDITDYLKLDQTLNRLIIECEYDHSKKFMFFFVIVKLVPFQRIINQILHAKKITKQQDLKILQENADDENEIKETSIGLSLICPFSQTRMKIPARFRTCNHIDCFELTHFVEMQRKNPNPLCQQCSKPTKFKDLAVDEYFEQIIREVPSDVTTVRINPDGSLQKNNIEAPKQVDSPEIICISESEDEEEEPQNAQQQHVEQQLEKPVDEQMYEQMHGQMHEQRDEQMFEQTEEQTDEQTDDRMPGQTDEQMPEQTDDRMREQTDDRMHEQTDDRMREQTDEQMPGQMHQQLPEQTDEQIREQIDEQISEQADEQIDEQIPEQTDEQIREQIDEQIDEQLDEPMDEQVDQQLDEPMDQQVDEQVDQQVDQQADEQVDGQVDEQMEPQQADQQSEQQPQLEEHQIEENQDKALGNSAESLSINSGDHVVQSSDNPTEAESREENLINSDGAQLPPLPPPSYPPPSSMSLSGLPLPWVSASRIIETPAENNDIAGSNNIDTRPSDFQSHEINVGFSIDGEDRGIENVNPNPVTTAEEPNVPANVSDSEELREDAAHQQLSSQPTSSQEAEIDNEPEPVLNNYNLPTSFITYPTAGWTPPEDHVLSDRQRKLVAEIIELRKVYDTKIGALEEFKEEQKTLLKMIERRKSDKALKQSLYNLSLEIEKLIKWIFHYYGKLQSHHYLLDLYNIAPFLSDYKQSKKSKGAIPETEKRVHQSETQSNNLEVSRKSDVEVDTETPIETCPLENNEQVQAQSHPEEEIMAIDNESNANETETVDVSRQSSLGSPQRISELLNLIRRDAESAPSTENNTYTNADIPGPLFDEGSEKSMNPSYLAHKYSIWNRCVSRNDTIKYISNPNKIMSLINNGRQQLQQLDNARFFESSALQVYLDLTQDDKNYRKTRLLWEQTLAVLGSVLSEKKKQIYLKRHNREGREDSGIKKRRTKSSTGVNAYEEGINDSGDRYRSHSTPMLNHGGAVTQPVNFAEARWQSGEYNNYDEEDEQNGQSAIPLHPRSGVEHEWTFANGRSTQSDLRPRPASQVYFNSSSRSGSGDDEDLLPQWSRRSLLNPSKNNQD